ncbi:MAG: cyclic nucleotide-binding domain-containing protein [Myxococcaceae bacterium]|nr:cyclic nucleotide-binding domain-containing protein [Myxococcaceae bacterium]
MSLSDDLSRFSKLFSVLEDDARKKLMSLSKKKVFVKGDVICREGEQGGDFFVLTKGTVSVSGDDLLGRKFELATLKAGEFFGELAALTGQRRQATVTAAEDVEVMCFPPAAVAEVVKTSAPAMEVMQKAGLHRTEDTMKKMME